MTAQAWRRVRWVVAALLLPLLPWVAGVLRNLVTVNAVEVIADDDFAGGASGRLISSTGFSPCPDGLCLGPGTRGTLEYVVIVPPERPYAAARIWINSSPALDNDLEVSTNDGASYRSVATNVLGRGDPLPLARATGSLRLRIRANNTLDHEALVLDKLTTVSATHPLRALPPTWAVAAAAAALGLGVFLGLPSWRVASVALLIVLAVVPRYQALLQHDDTPLDPDAQTYRIYARVMQPFSDKGFYSAQFSEREPVFVLYLWGATGVLGDSDRTLRLASGAMSVALVAVTTIAGQALFGPVSGFTLGLLMAGNGPWIQESFRGLRTEIEGLGLLVYLLIAFIQPRQHGWHRAAILGLLAGSLALLRSTYLPALLALNALALWQAPAPIAKRLVRIAVASLIAVALVTPHRVSMYRLHGDAFWDTTGYARWNANHEFAGTPGFPSREAVAVNGYQGERITFATYMFGMHSVSEVIAGTARGYVKLLGRMDQCGPDGREAGACLAVNRTLQALAVIGFVLALLSPSRRWIPLAFLVVEFPMAFLYDRRLLEPYRHTIPAFSLVLFAATMAVRQGLAGLRRPAPSDGATRSGLPRWIGARP